MNQQPPNGARIFTKMHALCNWYTPYAINDILQQLPRIWCKTGNEDEKFETLNAAISFDIETTSTYTDDGKKFAFMYVWALDINDCTIIGRTWQEFINLLQTISNQLELSTRRRILIYVHNLAYEFQFIQHYFQWAKIFATDTRKPLYARTDTGIEFRCSYRLTGYGLEKVGEIVGIEKLIGDLDYTEIRHCKTKLKDNEIQYLIHDVKIVSECIRRKITEENGIIHIPLTKTGYVRRLFRAKCLHGKEYIEYMEMISRLKLTIEEYDIAKQAFAGGFTHANFMKSGKVFDNVTSYDIGSSYPTVLVCRKYPCSAGKKYYFNNIEHLKSEMYSTENGYLLQLKLKNLQSKFNGDNYISYSKCLEISKDAVINNGRVFKADEVVITISNVDYQIIEKCYKFDIVYYSNCYRYDMDYLPKPFVETLLKLYADKTQLKDVTGKEDEYLSSKENVNASYGMCVTEIIRDIIEYTNNQWYLNGKPANECAPLSDEEKEKQMAKENRKRGRFLFYIWGVYVTAYARQNLWKAILECGTDYIYSDTDSVKILNAENHLEFFREYNKQITNDIETALKHHGIDLSLAKPKTIKGIEKPLGIFEFDGHYMKFKTLGAKRYMVQYSFDARNKKNKMGKFELTVAGLNKGKACDFITKFKRKTAPFDFFRWGMYIPEDYTGKLTHTYIDNTISAIVTDKDGFSVRVTELSSVHLSKQDYKLSIGKKYAEFLKGKSDVFSK